MSEVTTVVVPSIPAHKNRPESENKGMVSQGVLFLPTAVILGSSEGKEEKLCAKSSKNEAELLALLNWGLSYLQAS